MDTLAKAISSAELPAVSEPTEEAFGRGRLKIGPHAYSRGFSNEENVKPVTSSFISLYK